MFHRQGRLFSSNGSSIKSKLTSIPDCQSIIKKAIVEKLKESYRVDWFKESGTLYRIEFFISRDIVTIMIDTSGAPLHKRGYRPDSNAAPLRETLAAAMVKSPVRAQTFFYGIHFAVPVPLPLKPRC